MNFACTASAIAANRNPNKRLLLMQISSVLLMQISSALLLQISSALLLCLCLPPIARKHQQVDIGEIDPRV